MRALAKSPDHIMSFSAVFGLSQTLGGLAGAAAFSAFLTYRTRDHLAAIAQNLTLANPALAADIQRNAAPSRHPLRPGAAARPRRLANHRAGGQRSVGGGIQRPVRAAGGDGGGIDPRRRRLWLYRRYYKIDILAAEKAKVFAALGK